MRKRALLLPGLFLALAATAAYPYDNGDFQIWHSEGQEKEINDSSRITMEEEFRWGDNANQLYYHHYDAGFLYSFNKNFDLSINYRHIYERKKGKFRIENRPHMDATLKFALAGGFAFSDRSSFEYRHFDYQSDSFRYRNKFTVRFPWKITRLNIQPYISDEIFISSLGAAFNNNRFYSGIGLSVNKNIKGELYYLLQHTRTASSNGANWPHVNVWGTKVKVIF